MAKSSDMGAVGSVRHPGEARSGFRATQYTVRADVSFDDSPGRLLLELQARQLELELQNDELRRTHVELVRARDELADLYERAPVGYVTTDENGLVLTANLRFAALLSREREAIVGHNLANFILADDQDCYYLQRQALREGAERQAHELRVCRADGESVWVALESVVARGGQGGWQTRSAVSDITERRRADQERLRIRECMLQPQKMEAIGTLAGGLAHDMNNVLARVLLFGTSLERRLPAGDPTKQDAADIVAAAIQGKKLTQDLLNFTRKSPHHKELCSVRELIARVVALLQRMVPKRVAIEAIVDGTAAAIECDADHVMQMLMNLCLNAVDAIPDHGTITIAASDLLAEDAELADVVGRTATPHVRIAISDDGVGMDVETRRRAFDPFFTTKVRGKGTGLGLFMVYGAVQELHGAIRVDSEPHRGTTVRIFLPAHPAPAAQERRQIPAPRAEQAGSGVLVVDDEQRVREAIARVLRDMGYQVMIADGGASAVEIYRDHALEIDVVLLDLSMPGMDGAECFERLRQLDPGVRVVFCTGHARGDAARVMGREGMPRVVCKPFMPEELAEVLAEVLRSRPPVSA